MFLLGGFNRQDPAYAIFLPDSDVAAEYQPNAVHAIALVAPTGQSLDGNPSWEISYPPYDAISLSGVGTSPSTYSLPALNPGESYRLRTFGTYAAGTSWERIDFFDVPAVYTLKQRNKADELLADETYLTTQSYFDVEIESPSEFFPTITINDETSTNDAILNQSGGPLATNTGVVPSDAILRDTSGNRTQYGVRLALRPDTNRVEFSFEFTGPGQTIETRRIFVANNDSTPTGQVITGVTDGETLENNDNKVRVTLGAAEPKPSTLTGVTIAIIRLTDNRVMTSSSYPDDSSKGISGVSTENLGPGEYVARTTYTYSDPADNYSEETHFTVAGAVTGPYPSSLSLAKDTIFVDETFTAYVYTDHREIFVLHRLIINGNPQIITPLQNKTGSRSLVIPLVSILINNPGTYELIWEADFQGVLSQSPPVTLTVQAIPVATLLEEIAADPLTGDWQAVIDSPVATATQKQAAQQALNLQQAINNPGVLHGQFQVAAQFQALATAEFNSWAQSAPNIPFLTWYEQIRSDSSEASAVTTKNAIADHSTSSVGALLNSLNSLAFPLDTDPRFVMGSNWETVNQAAQSRGGNVADALVLATYRRYQDAIAATNSRPLPIFSDFVQQSGGFRA